mgnify:CR=1 FL=1
MAQGRGHLSSIDLLPEEAWPHVRAALDALAKNRRTQEAIRDELNTHLLALGLTPVSKSSFNRRSLALAKIGADIARTREMAAVFAEKLNDMPEGDVGMLINEMVKTLLYDLTERASVENIEVSAKMAKDISLAVFRLEQAGSISTKRRREIEDRAKAKVTEAVKEVGKIKGISSDTQAEIIEKILGKPKETGNGPGSDG